MGLGHLVDFREGQGKTQPDLGRIFDDRPPFSAGIAGGLADQGQESRIRISEMAGCLHGVAFTDATIHKEADRRQYEGRLRPAAVCPA